MPYNIGPICNVNIGPVYVDLEIPILAQYCLQYSIYIVCNIAPTYLSAIYNIGPISGTI